MTNKPDYLVEDDQGNELGALWVKARDEQNRPTQLTGTIMQEPVILQAAKADSVKFGIGRFKASDEPIEQMGVVFHDHKGKFGPTRADQQTIKLRFAKVEPTS